MVCPFCGSTTDGIGGRCSSCGRSIVESNVALATATPLPPSASDTIANVTITTGGMAALGLPGMGPLVPGQAFGSRYRILKVLGAGGMGVVYQAWDQALEVPVALKVIRPEVIADKTAAEEVERRFKRELLLARQVTHRNVVRIHDLGEIDGIKYISMPFVEGRDLSSILLESGRLSVANTLAIVRQVADGLAAAHGAGVVHRDLKPENVMIDAEGRPVIMDFGISRTVAGGTTMGLTTAGSVVGTIEYMAPEQALGQPVDQRADIYALGLMAYDLIAGRQRLAAVTTPVTEMMQRLQQAPPPLRSKVSDVPEAVERIIARALEPDPAKRYQSIRELIADIDALDKAPVIAPPSAHRQVPLWTVGVAIVLAILIGVGAWLVFGPPQAQPVEHEPISVLIADFDNTTGDEVFEGAVEQALGIGLEGATFVTAFPRRDALRAAAQISTSGGLNENTAQLVARREGVKVVLAGVVSRDADGYRIQVKALDPADNGKELAAREVRAGNKAAVLDAVGTLAAGIRKDLGDTTIEDDTLSKRETFTASSLEAARAYSLAQELSNQGKDEDAIKQYEDAIARDPQFGRAYSGLASVEARTGRLDAARQHFERAIQLADKMTDREKLRTQGAYHVQILGDNEQGITIYSELVKRYPADGAAHNNLAVAYFNTRDFQKALEEGREVLKVFPRSVVYRYNYALYAMYAGDFDTAAREAKAALELNPSTPKAYLALAMASLARGDAAAAKSAYQSARTAGPRGISLASMGLADIALYEGRFDEAIGLLQTGIRADLANKSSSAAALKQVALAEALVTLGRKAEATVAVEAALKAPHVPGLAVPAAQVLIDLGRPREAEKLARELEARLSRHDKAAAHIIDARLALAAGRPQDAVTSLREAAKDDDFWLVRYTLGSAYVSLGIANGDRGVFASALSELERCERRIGEYTAAFLDDVPTFRYRVPLEYWKGRAQHGLQQASAASTLKEFVSRRPAGAGDPMTTDARTILATY